MPLRHEEVLTLEEIRRVAEVLTELGIRRIRVTGGEPLVRRNAMSLVQELTELPSRPEIVMTTNGVFLGEHLEALAKTGVRKINISLDTLRRETYRELTGEDALDRVKEALEKALSMGFEVKVNTVLIRGINDTEAEEIALLAKDGNVTVRFIELMPMGCAGGLTGVSGDALLQQLEARFGTSEPVVGNGEEGSGPARYVWFPGFCSPVGFIDPISHRFCRDCNRIRLTVDGHLKLCLFYPDGIDLREPLRNGCSDEELAEMIRGAILLKPKRHEFVRGEAEEEKSMVQIGG